MKKLKDLISRRVSNRNAFYAAILIAIISIVFYSCRKYELEESPIGLLPGLSEKAQVKPIEVFQWLKEQPVEVSSVIKLDWKGAKQAIIKGKHMVRVPISKTSFMIFTKNNEKSPLSAYSYTWNNEKPNEKKFTGKVIWFSFQDYRFRTQQIKNNVASGANIIKTKKDYSVLAKYKAIIKSLVDKKKQRMNSGQMTIASDPCDDEPVIPGWGTQGCEGVANDIISLFETLGCLMHDGSWEDLEACVALFNSFNANEHFDTVLDQWGNEGFIDSGWMQDVLQQYSYDNPETGGGGGGSYISGWVDYGGWEMQYLYDYLPSLTINQADFFLSQDYIYYRLMVDTKNYLIQGGSQAIADAHINLMMSNSTYADWVLDHRGPNVDWQGWGGVVWFNCPEELEDEDNYNTIINNGYLSVLVPDNAEIQAFESDYRDQMTAAEITIFDNMNRLNQLLYLNNARMALQKAQDLFPTLDQHNTKADAFRHAYFSGLNCLHLTFTLAEQLGNAHENWVGNPPLERQMDSLNNKSGRDAVVAMHIDGHYSDGHFESICLGLANDGYLKIIIDNALVPSNE